MIRRRARFRIAHARLREGGRLGAGARGTPSRRSADGATAIEIGLPTGLAAVVAVAVALPSSVLVLRALDPLFAVPWGDLGAVRAGVVLVTVGGAGLVGRTARRDTCGQVLRDAARPPPRH